MLAHLWEFVAAVLHQWGALVTGSVIAAAIAVSERVRGKSISGWPLWSAIIVSLFFAFFFAWQNERIEVERLTSSNIERTPDGWISMTPRELVGVFEDRTEAQANLLTIPYIGKRMKVTRAVHQIIGSQSSHSGGGVVYAMDEHEVDVLLDFNSKWAEQLLALRKGDEITAIGVINKIEHNAVWLDKCDLVTVVRATPAPTATISSSATAVSPSPSSR